MEGLWQSRYHHVYRILYVSHLISYIDEQIAHSTGVSRLPLSEIWNEKDSPLAFRLLLCRKR